MEEERGKERERERLVGKDHFLGRGKIFFRSYYSPLRQKDCTQGGEPPVIFIVYVWLLLSRSPLATLDSRLLKYSRIRVARRNFPSIHLSVPFSSLSLSLFERVFFKYRYALSFLPRTEAPRRRPSPYGFPTGGILIRRSSIHPSIHMHICRGNACSTRRKAFLDPWPTASRPLPYFESMPVPKSR